MPLKPAELLCVKERAAMPSGQTERAHSALLESGLFALQLTAASETQLKPNSAALRANIG